MEDRDDDRSAACQPDYIMILTAVDANAVRQPIQHFESGGSVADRLAARLDLIEIRLCLVDTPRFIGVKPDAAHILFGGER